MTAVYALVSFSLAEWMYLQTSPGSGSFDLLQAIGSIGVGAVLAVPFVIVWRIAMARIRDLEAEVKTLNASRITEVLAQVTREKELSDSMAPLLADAAEALRDTPSVFDRVLEKAQGSAQRNETDLRLRQMEIAMDAMVRKFSQPREGTHE